MEILALFLAAIVFISAKKDYTGYKLYSVTVIQDQIDDLYDFGVDLDFWTVLERPVKVLVHQEIEMDFLEYLDRSNGSEYTLIDGTNLLYQLEKNVNVCALVYTFGAVNLDFWRPLLREGKPIRFWVEPDVVGNFSEYLSKRNISFIYKSTAVFEINPPIELHKLVYYLSPYLIDNNIFGVEKTYVSFDVDASQEEVVREELESYNIIYSVDSIGISEFGRFVVTSSVDIKEIMNKFGNDIDIWTVLQENGRIIKFLVENRLVNEVAEYLEKEGIIYSVFYTSSKDPGEFHINPNTPINKTALLSMFGDSIDFWSPLKYDREPITIRVKINAQADFAEYLTNNTINYKFRQEPTGERMNVTFQVLIRANDMFFFNRAFQNQWDIIWNNPITIKVNAKNENDIRHYLKLNDMQYILTPKQTEFAVSPIIDQARNLSMMLKEIEFWSPFKVPGTVNVFVSPHIEYEFVDFLKKHRMEYSVIIEDLEHNIIKHDYFLQYGLYKKKVDTEAYITGEDAEPKLNFSWVKRYQAILDYLYNISVEYFSIVSLEYIGKTYEGRDMVAVKFSLDEANDKRPVMLIDAGIHGENWLAIAIALYIIQQMIEEPVYTRLIQNVDWYILPVLNPDGYEYTHTNDRLWEKTLGLTEDINCPGTNLDRNFDYYWDVDGFLNDSCSRNFKGLHPFSEIELRNYKQFVMSYAKRIKLYISLRSHYYENFILYPWGYTDDIPDDADDLGYVGDLVASAMMHYKNRYYKVENTRSVLGPSSGCSVDWMKGAVGVDLSYILQFQNLIEDKDKNPKYSITSLEEGFLALKEFCSYVEQKYGIKEPECFAEDCISIM